MRAAEERQRASLPVVVVAEGGVRGLLRLLQFKFTHGSACTPLLSSLPQHEKKGCCCNRFFVVLTVLPRGGGHAATHAMNQSPIHDGR
jgi:hypothetical protein